ncbi:hypothetical protein ACLOJK_011571 [Asimina triloba]
MKAADQLLFSPVSLDPIEEIEFLSMEGLMKLCFSLALLFLFADLALSADSPAPAPSLPEGQVLQTPVSPPNAPASLESPSSGAPASPPTIALTPPHSLGSPPAPPPSQDNDAYPSPAPEPSAAGDGELHVAENQTEKSESGGGMKDGQKAGIAIGVIIGAGIVGLGGFVYKKRRDNIRRSQYGYAARRELL